MKDCKTFISFLFIIAVSILLIRPVVIFSSTTLQSLFSSSTKVSGIKSIVKKRKETTRIGNIITKEVENITVLNRLLAFSLLAHKQWLRNLLFALSSLLTLFTFLIKKRTTLFEIVPDNHHYLALSVIRI